MDSQSRTQKNADLASAAVSVSNQTTGAVWARPNMHVNEDKTNGKIFRVSIIIVLLVMMRK